MVKFNYIKILGYKNIQEANLTFTNLNVIIGPNNSGKSNFIQIFSFLDFLVNGAIDDVEKAFSEGFFYTNFDQVVPNKNKGPKKEGEKGLIEFELGLSNESTKRVFKYSIALEWEWKASLYDYKFVIKRERFEVKKANTPGKSSKIFGRLNNKVDYGSEYSKTSSFKNVPAHFSVVRILKLLGGSKAYTDAIESLALVIKTPTFYFSNVELARPNHGDRLGTFKGRLVSFDLSKEIMELESTDKWEIFKTALQNVLKIDRVTVDKYPISKSEERKYLYFTHFGLIKKLTDLSDGSVLIIALITKVLSADSDLFLIEEPENSTHPRALVDLIAFINSFSESKQFIISSHSIALLNKVKSEDVIVSCINSNGMSTLYNVDDRKDLKKRLKLGHVNFSDELFFAIEENNGFD